MPLAADGQVLMAADTSAIRHWRRQCLTCVAPLLVDGIIVSIAGCASDEVLEARDAPSANTNGSPATNPEISPAQLDTVRDLVTKSGFVRGEFEIAMTTPAIDQDGTVTGVVALVRLREPLNGEIVLPSTRAADDDSGQRD